jgi:hypothetical protein
MGSLLAVESGQYSVIANYRKHVEIELEDEEEDDRENEHEE